MALAVTRRTGTTHSDEQRHNRICANTDGGEGVVAVWSATALGEEMPFRPASGPAPDSGDRRCPAVAVVAVGRVRGDPETFDAELLGM